MHATDTVGGHRRFALDRTTKANMELHLRLPVWRTDRFIFPFFFSFQILQEGLDSSAAHAGCHLFHISNVVGS